MKPDYKINSIEAEIDCLKVIVQQFELLDPEAIPRVLNYLNDRYGSRHLKQRPSIHPPIPEQMQ